MDECPGGLPPAGFRCEVCYPKGIPQVSKKPTPAEVRQVQQQRWDMVPLNRWCAKCEQVRVHFPYPRKKKK